MLRVREHVDQAELLEHEAGLHEGGNVPGERGRAAGAQGHVMARQLGQGQECLPGPSTRRVDDHEIEARSTVEPPCGLFLRVSGVKLRIAEALLTRSPSRRADGRHPALHPLPP